MFHKVRKLFCIHKWHEELLCTWVLGYYKLGSLTKCEKCGKIK